jgi:hypothetical protein
VAGVGSAVLDWVTGGSALAALGKVSLAVCALVLGLLYPRYLGILGADRRRPAELQAYDAMRANLAEGNIAARLYADRLRQFLDWIDRFFGDAGMADRTLFPHAFRAEDACTAMDGSGLRPLPASDVDLPCRSHFRHLGGFRPCRPGRVRIAPEARSRWLATGPSGGGRSFDPFVVANDPSSYAND